MHGVKRGVHVPIITFRALRIPRLFVVLCLCLTVIAWVGYRVTAPPHSISVATPPGDPSDETRTFAEPGKAAPNFTLTDLSGKPIALSTYRGRPVILYFWASWCPYCVQSIPQLNELQAAHEEEGLQILAIDILEKPETVRKVARELKISFPVLLDEHADVTQTYLVKATPTYIFIDRQGVYRDILVGSPRRGAVEGRLDPLLKPLEKDIGPKSGKSP